MDPIRIPNGGALHQSGNIRGLRPAPVARKEIAPPMAEVKKPRAYNFDPTRSRQEHVTYFKELAAEEVAYMTALADHYEAVAKRIGSDSGSPRLNEDTTQKILCAVGQARLLSAKKIQQFVGLIADCEFKRGDKATDPTDLAGFWEMIYMQVLDIHDKFDDLGARARNDWKTPLKTSVADGALTRKIPPAEKKRTVRTAPVQASSKIREAIEAARRAQPAMVEKTS